MKNKFFKKISIFFALGTMFLTGCSDFKTPKKGYITKEEVDEIVSKFSSESLYSKYSYSGNFNYFDYPEDKVPHSVSVTDSNLRESLDTYNNNSSSYYLRLPLHITPENWRIYGIGDEIDINKSCEYQLESKVYRPAGQDKIYYYNRDEGGFILRTFGVNKPLIIKRPSDVTCRAKWNIEIEYDKDGYLVSEKFATVNSSENNKDDCCYGQATYTYIV